MNRNLKKTCRKTHTENLIVALDTSNFETVKFGPQKNSQNVRKQCSLTVGNISLSIALLMSLTVNTICGQKKNPPKLLLQVLLQDLLSTLHCQQPSLLCFATPLLRCIHVNETRLLMKRIDSFKSYFDKVVSLSLLICFPF